MAVFRGKFMAALLDARAQAALPRDPQGRNALDWQQRQRKLYQHDWVVYAKTPLGGPAEVLSYLSRYTHRTAISNDRLVRMDAEKVWLKVRDQGQSGHTARVKRELKRNQGNASSNWRVRSSFGAFYCMCCPKASNACAIMAFWRLEGSEQHWRVHAWR